MNARPLWIKVLVSVVAIELLGGLGGWITSSQIPNWYSGLATPVGTPPNWLFGPVWGTLYALIGTAFALVWHRVESGPVKRRALTCFVIQLALNLVWTPIFFGLHAMLFALIVIVTLWVAIALTYANFRRVHPVAAALLVPYWLWVSYATYLNAGYWLLNR